MILEQQIGRKRRTSPSKLRQTKTEEENPQVMDKGFSPTPKKQTQEEDLVDRLRIFPQVENSNQVGH